MNFKYKVLDKEFFFFEDVVKYAWNEYKVMLMDGDIGGFIGPLTDEQELEACKQLENMIKADPK